MAEPRSYDHILEAVQRTPWAIKPEVLEQIVSLLALRANGGRYTAEEIAARIGAGPAGRGVTQVGTVAVLPLYGVLFPKASLIGEMSGGTSLARFLLSFREAMASSTVSRIVIDVDSPGGLVDLCPEVANEIRGSRGKGKPITAVANTEAASGAYWIASQADELVVTPSGQVGSIGVFSVHDDVSAALEAMGIKKTLISAGRFKTEGNPFEPLSDEGREAFQATVDAYYRMFTTDVAKGRGVSVKAVQTGYGEGRMLTAQAALAAGMVDGIATFEEVLQSPGARRTGARSEALASDTSDSAGIVGGESIDAEAAPVAPDADNADADPKPDDAAKERSRRSASRSRGLSLHRHRGRA